MNQKTILKNSKIPRIQLVLLYSYFDKRSFPTELMSREDFFVFISGASDSIIFNEVKDNIRPDYLLKFLFRNYTIIQNCFEYEYYELLARFKKFGEEYEKTKWYEMVDNLIDEQEMNAIYYVK